MTLINTEASYVGAKFKETLQPFSGLPHIFPETRNIHALNEQTAKEWAVTRDRFRFQVKL
jgi:hypothetical protein